LFSDTPGTDLIAGLKETSASLISEFEQLDEADAGETPGFDEWAIREGEDWSVKQLIAHLTEIERDLVTEAVEFAGHPGGEIGQPVGTLWGSAQNVANERPMTAIVDAFQEVHEWTLNQLAPLTDEDLKKEATHRAMGTTTVLTALSGVLGHRRMHLFQARSNLVSLQGHRDGRSPEGQYSVYGDGELTVLLVDSGTSHWDPISTALAADGARVVQHHFVAQSSDVERLREELDVGELVIGGTASGAVDACKYAIVHSDQIRGLIMANMPILRFYRDRPDDFSAVNKPTLSLVGANHPQTELVKQRAAEFAQHRLVVIDDAGRDLPGEQPDAMIAAIKEFLHD
jgi:hypothetical protein